MKVSRDVTFDKKSLWDWTDRDKEQYVFYPIDTDRKEIEEEPIEPLTPSSLASSTLSSATSSASSVDSPVKTGPQGKRSLEEIYEIDAIEKNTWELTTFQMDKKPIVVKWAYKVKKNSKGKVERYKARLVVTGYKQTAEIDYDKVFAPVTQLERVRLLISSAALNKWKIH
ncbi:hypothetical protein RJ639_023868 [Escallonia herrerae]|uniref:Reverse transcriptase Ty1/copia-type domain-containing protein n=1 Tax=Escallonia herrerae TaxID=1293975 RepID=A0AA89ACZ8_9ASTE|nr:hypothetical protein RJ639_023868 [Escallonia herrerae]